MLPETRYARTWRLRLVRAANLAIDADPSMEDLFRTDFEGTAPRVRASGGTLTVDYHRGLRGLGTRRHPGAIWLNPSVAWELEARGGLSKLTADLRGLELRLLEAGRGAREVELWLPRPSGMVSIRFTAGASDVAIHRPTGVAIRFRVTGGASDLTLDEQHLGAVGGETDWQSPGYASATHGYDVSISRGARSVTSDTVEAAPETGPAERMLATVLFTDIVGSTQQAVDVGDRRWGELLDLHDQLTRRLVGQERGRLVKSTGDGILATFDGPGRGIRCAVGLREELRAIGVEIRAGLHSGEVAPRGDDVGGIAVNIAARIMEVAGPGEILVSRTVRDLVAGSDARLEDRGSHALKGIKEDWQLFAIR